MAGAVGIVRAINRAEHQVTVEALGSHGPEASGLPARRPLLYPKYLGDPPPPHSWVQLTQLHGGVWHVADAGPRANRRLIVHDDFTTAFDTNPVLWADTVWALYANPPSLVFENAPTGGCFGVAFLVTQASPGESCTIAKDPAATVLQRDIGYWFSARIAPHFLSAVDVLAGFSNLEGTDCYISYTANFGGLTYLGVANSGFASNVAIPFLPQDEVFFDLDIVLVPERYAAGWINGSGPYFVEANVPPAGFRTAPFALARTNTTDNRGLFIDWVHVETFKPCAQRSDLVLPGTFVA